MDVSGEKLDETGANLRTRMRMPVRVDTNLPSVSADVVGSHFAALRWSLNSVTGRAHIHLLALSAGRASIAAEDSKAQGVAAPTICWLPAACADHLDLMPGSTAQFLRIKADVAHRYLAPGAESAFMELLKPKTPLILPVELATADTIARSIACIALELAQPGRFGAASIISSELTLCVLRCHRLLPERSGLQAAGTSMDVLRRFRRLVEERFQEHLPISAYADLLGVTADRLHAICTRVLKRSPRELIQQRIVQEGLTRLETSGATLKQVAFALGFKDTAYFSRFFKKHSGKPPGAWRRGVAKTGANSSNKPLLNFADWP